MDAPQRAMTENVATPLMPPLAAGAYLGGIPEATLAVWRSTNRVRLPFVRIGGRVMYRRSDLDAFIEQNLHNAVAE